MVNRPRNCSKMAWWLDWYATDWCFDAGVERNWLYVKSWPTDCSQLFRSGYEVRLEVWCSLLWREADRSWCAVKLRRVGCCWWDRARLGQGIQHRTLVHKIWSLRHLYKNVGHRACQRSNLIHSWSLEHACKNYAEKWSQAYWLAFRRTWDLSKTYCLWKVHKFGCSKES